MVIGWIFNWLPKTNGDTKRPSMVCSIANTIKTLINISGPATKPNTKAGNMAKKLPKYGIKFKIPAEIPSVTA